MTRRLGLALLLVVWSLPGDGWAEGDPLRGTWRLVSFDVITLNGQVVEQLMGSHPLGLIIYDGARVCVQITRRDRVNFAASDIRTGTAPEKKSAYETYLAYCGTYTVNEPDGLVIHHLEFSLFPNWTGTDQRRFFQLAGDRLTLTTPPYPNGGGQVIARLVWERAR